MLIQIKTASETAWIMFSIKIRSICCSLMYLTSFDNVDTGCTSKTCSLAIIICMYWRHCTIFFHIFVTFSSQSCLFLLSYWVNNLRFWNIVTVSIFFCLVTSEMQADKTTQQWICMGIIKLSPCSPLIAVLHLFSDSEKWYSENCNYNV